MNKSPSFNVLLIGLGIGCAGVLVWLWGLSFPPVSIAPAPPAAREEIAATPPSSATPPATEPDDSATRAAAVRSLLATLQRAFARGGVREREAVLAFKDDAALQRFLARAPTSGLTVLGTLDPLRAVRVRIDSLRGLQGELFENLADYADVAANALIGIPHPPPREERAAQNEVPFGNATLAYLGADGDRSGWGRGLTIAVLDTGVAPDATFGLGRLRTLDIGLGTSPGTGSEDGHGTAVAALAAGLAADAPGLAPSADVLSVRVTDRNGTSDLFTISRAIVAAVDAGATIVNISLGGYSTGAVLDAAIGYATQKGALIVAAAGNDQAAQLAWPAADPRVLSVGAIDRAEQQVSFSNSGEQLQLTAPGYGVQTAWLGGQRVTVDGTSASAPLVAGAVAAVMSQNPNLTPQQAAEHLEHTASDGGTPGPDAAYGRGMLNVGWAMNSDNPNYVDTAVSSHSFNAATHQMEVVVQNRSGRTVTGLSLAVTAGTTLTTQLLPSLSAGESYVAKVSVTGTAFETTGSLSINTQLNNPAGVTDRIPANNRRTSTLTRRTP